MSYRRLVSLTAAAVVTSGLAVLAAPPAPAAPGGDSGTRHTLTMPDPDTAPSAPTAFTVTPNAAGTSVTVAWQPPSDDGGQPVDGYVALRSGGGGFQALLGADARTYEWLGLVPGSTETFEVRARNAVGYGAAASLTITLPDGSTSPSAPTGFTVTPNRDGTSVTVAWQPPADDGGKPVTGYVVLREGGGGFGDNVGADARSYTWLGLIPGSTETFAVRAVNEVGFGAAASLTITLPAGSTTPSAPTELTVTPTADGTSATVAWQPPSDDGGHPVTGYTVGRTGAANATTSAAPYRWTGLTPGATYTFGVAATNDRGTGAPAQVTVRMPSPQPPADATAPGAPKIGTARGGRPGGKATAKLTWTTPTYGGTVTGYRIIGYRLDRKGHVVRTITRGPVAAAAQRATVRMPRGRYRFAVVALGLAGSGPESARSKVVRVR